MTSPTVITNRPAETTAAGGTVALLVAYVLGVTDTETILLIGSGLGLLPAVVTTLVNSGGVRGVLRLVWQGRATTPEDAPA